MIYFVIFKLVKLNVRKRRIWVGPVKLYISALRLEEAEDFYLLFLLCLMLLLFVIMHYAVKFKGYFSCLKGAWIQS